MPAGGQGSLAPQLSSPFRGHGVVLLPLAVPKRPVSPGPQHNLPQAAPKPGRAAREPGGGRDPVLQSSALFQQCAVC